MKDDAKDKLIREYLREQDILTPELDRLIGQAQWDLNFGPGHHNDPGDDGAEFPGYEAATEQLAEWRRTLPGTLYIDTDAEQVDTSLPEGEDVECEHCGGTGEDPLYQEEDEEECSECNGEGTTWREPDLSEYQEYDRAAIFRAVVGKDIASNM